MLNFSPVLGINLPRLGKRNSLIRPSRLYQESRFPVAQLTQMEPLVSPQSLAQTSRILAAGSPDRLHYGTQQSEIGWDNWQPIERSIDLDNFDYSTKKSSIRGADRSSQVEDVESSELDFFTTILAPELVTTLEDDRSSQIEDVESSELDFFTTILAPELVTIDPALDYLPVDLADLELPVPLKEDRFDRADATQTESSGKSKHQAVAPAQELSESNKIEQVSQIEQQKSKLKAAKVPTNIQPPPTPQPTPEIARENTILTESAIALSLDQLALNAVDDSLALPEQQPLSLNPNPHFPSTELPSIDLAQISRSIDETAPNPEFPPELIADTPTLNLLNPPATINPQLLSPTTPPVTPVEPAATTTISSESSTLPLETTDSFTLLEQLSSSSNQPAPDVPSPRGFNPDTLSPQPLDTPTNINPVASPLVQKSTLADRIELAVESPQTLIPTTFPVNPLDADPMIDLPSTSAAELATANPTLPEFFDELATVNPTLPEFSGGLPSDPLPTTLPRSAHPAQISPSPNEIAPDIQFPQLLISDTLPLNLAEDPTIIDRTLASSPPLETSSQSPNLPESPSRLPADVHPTTLSPDPAPEQISTSPIQIASDLESARLFSSDTFELNPLDLPLTIDAQISTSSDEPAPANLEDSTMSESSNTLLSSDFSPTLFTPTDLEQIPRSTEQIEPDLTIESTPRLSLDPLQLSSDQSRLDNPLILVDLTETAQPTSSESSEEFSSDSLRSNPLAQQPITRQEIADSPQTILNRQEDTPTDIISQINPSTTDSPTISQEDSSLRSIDSLVKNSTDITIPDPIVGYATGGYVKDANHIDLQSIATSDTVSAMLTPGEFVINAKAAQKNLDLLTHINRGGEPESALPTTEIQPQIIEPALTSTDIPPTSIQRKQNDSLISPSLQQEIGLQQLSPLTNPGLDPFQSSQTERSNSSPTYSSLSMVFRKPISSPQPRYTGTDTPDEWGSIEDLMNGASNNSDIFSMDNSPQPHSDLESRSSPTISPKYVSPISRFAEDGEVTPSDLSTTIAPITHTIESPIADSQQQAENNDPAELEILAREIYHRLRQRLEIERERHGSYSGNLAW
jgi:hypothetical protein